MWLLFFGEILFRNSGLTTPSYERLLVARPANAYVGTQVYPLSHLDREGSKLTYLGWEKGEPVRSWETRPPSAGARHRLIGALPLSPPLAPRSVSHHPSHPSPVCHSPHTPRRSIGATSGILHSILNSQPYLNSIAATLCVIGCSLLRPFFLICFLSDK